MPVIMNAGIGELTSTSTNYLLMLVQKRIAYRGTHVGAFNL